MDKKQKMHVGYRSHSDLRALDAHLDTQSFTYPGWKSDLKQAEDYHIDYPILFVGKLAIMEKKQKMHVGDRSHSDLRALDAHLNTQSFTYPGWKDDVKQAEDSHSCLKRPRQTK
jgi:hypothetical protein